MLTEFEGALMGLRKSLANMHSFLAVATSSTNRISSLAGRLGLPPLIPSLPAGGWRGRSECRGCVNLPGYFESNQVSAGADSGLG